MFDQKILIGIGIVVVLMIVFHVTHAKESYASGNDLAWAAGLPGNCNTCGKKVPTNYANPNLMVDSLQSTVAPQAVDYYNRPAIPAYYGDALPDQLYGKLWGN